MCVCVYAFLRVNYVLYFIYLKFLYSTLWYCKTTVISNKESPRFYLVVSSFIRFLY